MKEQATTSNSTRINQKPSVIFSDNTEVNYELERVNNTVYKSNDRKRWEFVTGWACPFRENHSYVIQRLLGDVGTPGENGHDEYGWRPAPQPAQTRLVLMKMQDDGTLVNIHSGVKK